MINLSLYNYIKLPLITHSVVNDCKKFLKDNGKVHTLEHSLSVAKTCVSLASRFHLDTAIAETSAMLHDISSVMEPSDMMDYAVSCNWYIDEAEKRYPFILHQRISSVFARDIFGIGNQTILSMVECHSTLHKRPSVYDILLFISDKLSWDQVGIPPFFGAVSEALDRSLYDAALTYINFVIDHEMILYPHQWLLDAKSFLELASF